MALLKTNNIKPVRLILLKPNSITLWVISLKQNLSLKYIGNKKHKRWRPNGAWGSICPNWTHQVDGRHFGSLEPEAWDGWTDTEAQRLLGKSIEFGGQRYAATRGLAFCGQLTGDDTWHGYLNRPGIAGGHLV